MGSPVSIDHEKKSLTLDNKQVLDFDYLVVALGSANTDFGIPGVVEHALGMKSVHEATTIRAKVMRSFEELCSNQDGSVFSISVIGGGPTGVEMAGAFAELVRGPLKNDQERTANRIKINLIGSDWLDPSTVRLQFNLVNDDPVKPLRSIGGPHSLFVGHVM
jgi:NADH dehydrogenase